MNLKNIIQNELNTWTAQELIALGGGLTIILTVAFIMHDSIYAILAAFFGIMYTVLAGKGKVSCFYFGVIGSACYSYISYGEHLWGQLLLYMCYFIPMQILGIFQWRKNLKASKEEIVKTKLTTKERWIFFVIICIACCVSVYLLKHFSDDFYPIMDGIAPVLSIAGMVLTVKRCIEQWLVWFFVDGLTMLIWIFAVCHGSTSYSAAIMWGFYFIVSVYFLHEWQKEVKL